LWKKYKYRDGSSTRFIWLIVASGVGLLRIRQCNFSCCELRETSRLADWLLFPQGGQRSVGFVICFLLGFCISEYVCAVPRYLKLKGEYVVRNVGAYAGSQNTTNWLRTPRNLSQNESPILIQLPVLEKIKNITLWGKEETNFCVFQKYDTGDQSHRPSGLEMSPCEV
jgi:hypothetical protein